MVQIENASENEKEEKKMIKSGKTIAITNRKAVVERQQQLRI